MKAIVNSQYILENIDNCSFGCNCVFIQFKSEEAQNLAISKLPVDFKIDSGKTLISILNPITVSIFED